MRLVFDTVVYPTIILLEYYYSATHTTWKCTVKKIYHSNFDFIYFYLYVYSSGNGFSDWSAMGKELSITSILNFVN